MWKRSAKGEYNEIETLATAAKSDGYKRIKVMSHLSVLLGMELRLVISGQINLEDSATKLSKLDHDLSALSQSSDFNYSEDGKIVNLSRLLIEKIRICKSNDLLSNYLIDYLCETKPINKRYALEAVRLQYESLQNITQIWLAKEKIQVLQSRVLILGTHGPREGLIEQQYFQNWYARQGVLNSEEKLIYYAETLPEHMEIINLQHLITKFLAKEELNKIIARDLLGDAKGMSRDVLSPFSNQVLEEMDLKDQDKKKSYCPYVNR